MIVTYDMPRLYGKQAEAIDGPDRYAVIEASTKAGKTAGCLIWLLKEALERGGSERNFWWVAPVYSQTEIAFRRLKDYLRRADPDQATWSSNESKVWVKIVNGSLIWFKSADKPDSLYGEDVYGAVVDEGTRVKQDAWHAVRSTLTYTKGRIRIIGNVRGRKNWVYQLARKAEAGEPDWHQAKLTAYDAIEGGVLDPDEIEDAKRVLPEHVFRELYLAEPADDEGNPFGLDAIHACIGGDASWRGEKPIACWGVDLAKHRDWVVAIGLNDEGDVAAYQRWQSDWENTHHRLKAMLQEPALVDMTGVGDPFVERLQREAPVVHGLKFTSQSKQELMVGLASAIHQRKVRYPQGIIVHELEAFEYVVKTTPDGRVTGVSYQAAGTMTDDCVDALALAVEAQRQFGTPARLELVSVGDDYDDDEDDWC